VLRLLNGVAQILGDDARGVEAEVELGGFKAFQEGEKVTHEQSLSATLAQIVEAYPYPHQSDVI
jgi:hypothetical protein